MQNCDVRVDLHVHSRHSDHPYSYYLQSAGAAESYTDVADVLSTARARGMNLFTLTDHDVIGGALELCALEPRAFISEEVSARFPEDGNVMHVITLGISEAQHVELQRLRSNVYELAQYVEEQQIAHFVCHPLSMVNGRLRADHLERALLMFRHLEVRNGTRDEDHEHLLRRLMLRLGPEQLARWAEKHPHVPFINRAARWGIVGGSDDHGRVGIARAFTTFQGEASIEGLRAALTAQATEPGGHNGTSHTLGHNVYGVLWGFLRDSKSSLDSARQAGTSPLVRSTVVKHLVSLSAAELWSEGHTPEHEAVLGGAVGNMLADLQRSAAGALSSAVERTDLIRIADSVPDILKGALLSMPYLLGARYVARDRATARRLAGELGVPSTTHAPRVAVFTDSIDHVDGVSLGLRRLAATARAERLDLRICGGATTDHGAAVRVDDDGIVRLPVVARQALSVYPEYAFGVPFLPALVHWLVAERITLVQCSTPGPVGLAALFAARLLGISVVGQYHTDVPEYATRLTLDPGIGKLVGAVVGWFYRQMDSVLVPSAAMATRVEELGVSPGKVRRVPRGVDLELFKPHRRDDHAYAPYGLNGDPKVLYVGRISREKGLDALLEGFSLMTHPSARLILVGEGPYARELKARYASERVIFTGMVTGEPLAQLMASADVFAFPSDTETFGNAVVEAQAAGLPVVVARRGAASENVLHGVTGLVVDAENPGALRDAISRLLHDHGMRRRMGHAAHEWAKRFALPEAARGTFREYDAILRAAAQAPPAPPTAQAG